MLRCSNLGFSVNGTALVHGVSLNARSGEILGVVGPNGAGKSTLIRLLAGDLAASRGEVRVDDRLLATIPIEELSRRRAVLEQNHVLQFAFTVRDVVAMGRYPHRGTESPERDLAVIEKSMGDADVLHLAARTYPTLSGGEKKRASLARVLAQEAPIILLDEPTGSLDVRHQEMVMVMLKALAEAGAVVVAVLHDLNLAARYADRLALMEHGGLAALGPTAEVLEAGLLSRVYEHPVAVVPHPHRPCPMVLPLDPNGD